MSRTRLLPGARGRRGVLSAAIIAAALALSGCYVANGAENTGDSADVFVPTRPIDAVALHAEPAGPVSLSDGRGSVTFSWQALVEGNPSPHDDCVGMVSLTAPDNLLIDLTTDLTACAGRTELQLTPESTPGEYRLSVMLNGLRENLVYPVTR